MIGVDFWPPASMQGQCRVAWAGLPWKRFSAMVASVHARHDAFQAVGLLLTKLNPTRCPASFASRVIVALATGFDGGTGGVSSLSDGGSRQR